MKEIRFYIVCLLLVFFTSIFGISEAKGASVSPVRINQVGVRTGLTNSKGERCIGVRINYTEMKKIKKKGYYFHIWIRDNNMQDRLGFGNTMSKQGTGCYSLFRRMGYPMSSFNLEHKIPLKAIKLNPGENELEMYVTVSDKHVPDEKKLPIASCYPFTVNFNNKYSYLDSSSPVYFGDDEKNSPMLASNNTQNRTKTTTTSTSHTAASQASVSTNMSGCGVDRVTVEHNVSCPDNYGKGMRVRVYYHLTGKEGKRCRLQYYFKDTDSNKWSDLSGPSYCRANVAEDMIPYFYNNITPSSSSRTDYMVEKVIPYNAIGHHNGRNNYRMYLAVADENDKRLDIKEGESFYVNQQSSMASRPTRPHDWDNPGRYDPSRRTTASTSTKPKPSSSSSSSSKRTTSTTSKKSASSTSSSGNGAETKRVDQGNGYYMLVTSFRNGTQKREKYGRCTGCFGSGKCSVCNGSGYSFGTPCLFGTSGVCNICKGSGECMLSVAFYDRNGNEIDSTSINDAIGTDTGGDAELRYPEYQKYNENGKWSDRKYKQETRKKCRYCNGTGVHPTPESSNPGSRIAIYHHNGEKCGTCGKVLNHYHRKCPHCR